MPVELVVGPSPVVSDALFERYLGMCREVGGERVLALVDGGAARDWIRRLRELRLPRGEDRVLTPGAWARRQLDLWWPLIEPELAAGSWDRPAGVPDEPLFVQADLAQALMAAAVAPIEARTGAFATARTAPAMRHVHLLDTLHRASEQDLTLDEAARRLELGAATPDVARYRQHILPCLEAFRDLALRHRVLDAALTWWVFGRFLLPHPEFGAYLRREVQGLVVSGYEEAGPLLRRAILAAASVAGAAGRVTLGWRADGGQRSAAWRSVQEALSDWPEAVRTDVGDIPWEGPPARVELALRAPAMGKRLTRIQTASFPEMLDCGVTEAAAAREAGYSVAIVLPRVTQLQLWWLRRALAARGIPAIVTTGTNRLLDYRPVRVAMTLAGVAFPQAGLPPPDRDEWTDVLEEITGEDAYVVAGLADELAADPAILLAGSPEAAGGPADDALARLRRGFGELAAMTLAADRQAAGAMVRAANPQAAGAMARNTADSAAHRVADPVADREAEWATSWLAARADAESATAGVTPSPPTLGGVFRVLFARLYDSPDWEAADQIHQLVVTAERFEALDVRLGGCWGDRPAVPGFAGRLGRFFDFLLAGGFAERPMSIRPAPEDAVIVATASRFAQDGAVVDVQIWLDCSSPAWKKSEDRELTNARVLAAERPEGPYGLDEDEADAEDKLARTLLACVARARQRIVCLASLLDAEGREQPGGLADILGELELRACQPAATGPVTLQADGDAGKTGFAL